MSASSIMSESSLGSYKDKEFPGLPGERKFSGLSKMEIEEIVNARVKEQENHFSEELKDFKTVQRIKFEDIENNLETKDKNYDVISRVLNLS